MYLDHFGLNEAPFKITPVTDFFFPGANRAEILDALLYAITNSEGIIKVTGEVGSGKTMLSRMLIERTPDNVEAVYLANPSLSREEMLYAIADGLKLNLEGQRVNIILQTLQNHLELKISQGKCVVILVDEAHAMPLETLEELRLLYNLQVGNHKLMHIVLFGQPELNDKLSQPNMRQLKDRIIHHFSMLPLSKNIIESYLMFRMRAAGYRGPTPFSTAAAALIGRASQGLMRRVNILADKSLLAAFVENTCNIEVHHVRAAIRDSELPPSTQAWWRRKNTVIAGNLTLAATIIITMAAWITDQENSTDAKRLITSIQQIKPATQIQSAIPAPPSKTSAEEHASLFEQRLAATQAMLTSSAAGSASIQLFYTNDVLPMRIEGFLKLAENLGKLHEIFILPIKINGKQGLRVLYGNYSNSKNARAGMQHLPKRYLNAYAPSISYWKIDLTNINYPFLRIDNCTKSI